MGYSTSILQNPVCAFDKEKDRWRSKSRVVPSPELAPWSVSWKRVCYITGHPPASLCQVPGWGETLQPGLCIQGCHSQPWGEEVLRGYVFFFFFLLQMKHQRSEAYGVESSWLLSADLNQKSFKTSSSWRSLSSLSVPRNPGGDGGRHLWEPSCMPTVPCCAVVSYSSLSCWTKNAHLLHVDVHSSWIFSF